MHALPDIEADILNYDPILVEDGAVRMVEHDTVATGWFKCLYLQILSWITKAGLFGASDSTLYIASIYWATVTIITLGYGDIVPVTDIERWYA